MILDSPREVPRGRSNVNWKLNLNASIEDGVMWLHALMKDINIPPLRLLCPKIGAHCRHWLIRYYSFFDFAFLFLFLFVLFVYILYVL